MIKKIYLQVILATLLTPTFLFGEKRIETDNSNWKYAYTKNEITVYTRSIPGSKVHAFKAIAHLNAPAEKIVALMRDVEGTHEWSPDVMESKTVVNHTDLKATTYTAMNIPWPLNNRDLVLLNDLKLDEKNKYLVLHVNSVENKDRPHRKKFVRAHMEGKIYLRPLSEKKTSMMMFAHVDPKGKIPKWIVNIFQKKWPYKYFKSIEENANAKNKPLNPGLKKILSKLDKVIKNSKEKITALQDSPIAE